MSGKKEALSGSSGRGFLRLGLCCIVGAMSDLRQPDPRLPIKVVRVAGGARIDFADGRQLYAYGREPEIARQANAMTRVEAEQLAADVARALTRAWGGE